MDSNSSESPISQPPLSAKGHGLPSPTATSTTSPKHPAPQEHVNLRSCITCRRRKVRCDKKHPCSNCTRAHIPCSFPKPGRAPRKKRSDEVNSREIELLSRLRRLEGVVESLSGQVDSDKHNESNGNGEILRKASGSGMEQEFGRLMIGKGKTRYVNSSFWSSLNDEVDELPTGADNPSDSEGETEEEESIGTTPNSNQSWLFSFSSLAIDMQGFHPKPEKVRFLWETFIENVHPVTNLFHVPTMSKKIEDAIKDPASTDSGMEAFLFALYHAAITSMTADECLKVMGDEKSNLLTYYKFTIEQALARAGLLVTQELITLQAFTLYLICVRRHDATRYVWSLTGLAIRIAYALGLHRDGTLFALSPYETEMRRRVFWQIVILDVRASEDHGADPAIMEPTFDTKLPLNINDSDISPEDTAFPKERLGYSEMIFSLIRFEVTQTLRRLNYTPPGTCSNIKTPMSSASIADKEGWIEECHERIESKYLRHGNMKEPLFWVTATVARLVMAKMWLILHHPFHNRADKVNLSQETKDKLFDTSIEIIEYASMLETERTSRIWGWVFKTYVQWHAVAFLLTELCHRTEGPNVERAWKAAEASWSAWQEKLSPKKRTILWRPMRRLMSRAKHIREAELARRGASEYSRRTAPVEPAPIDTSAAPLIPEFIPSATSSLPSQQGELPAPFSQAPLIDPTATPSTLSSLMSNDAYKPYRDQQSDFDASPEAIEAMEAMEGDWTNWGDFDTMVRDFQVQMDEEGANERGPVLGSIGQWY